MPEPEPELVLVLELLVVLPAEDAPVAVDPPVEAPAAVDVAASTTGPTTSVVVDVGRLGVSSSASASQVSISAGNTPGIYAS